MTHSRSQQPDLDWSQVRETIKLLAVSVAQVDSSIKAGDESVNALAGSFTGMVDGMTAIHGILSAQPPSEARDVGLFHCESIQQTINSSIIAFQFYDRLSQCLQHTTEGLKGLSSLIDTPNRLYNPFEWHQFQEQIRARYTMESEKIMFDAVHQGKTIEEALKLAAEFDQQGDDDEIELF